MPITNAGEKANDDEKIIWHQFISGVYLKSRVYRSTLSISKEFKEAIQHKIASRRDTWHYSWSKGNCMHLSGHDALWLRSLQRSYWRPICFIQRRRACGILYVCCNYSYLNKHINNHFQCAFIPILLFHLWKWLAKVFKISIYRHKDIDVGQNSKNYRTQHTHRILFQFSIYHNIFIVT